MLVYQSFPKCLHIDRISYYFWKNLSYFIPIYTTATLEDINIVSIKEQFLSSLFSLQNIFLVAFKND